MENNIVKENYLEVIPNKEIIRTNENNVLPAIVIDKKLLLPVIVQNKELALINIKKDLENIKNHKIIKNIVKVVKVLAIILAKFIRYCFIAVASITAFIGVSAVIVTSTAIVTKNIVNSYCGSTPQKDTTYSIFKMKDDSTQIIHNK